MSGADLLYRPGLVNYFKCILIVIYTQLAKESLSSYHLYGLITNSQNDQLPVGLIAQLTDYCNGITDVMGSNHVQA